MHVELWGKFQCSELCPSVTSCSPLLDFHSTSLGTRNLLQFASTKSCINSTRKCSLFSFHFIFLGIKQFRIHLNQANSEITEM